MMETSPSPPPWSRVRTAASRLEPLLWFALVLFVLGRFGPQIVAWTGLPMELGGDLVGETLAWEPLTTLDGDPFDAPSGLGHVQVITFWATWCRVCSVELPFVDRVHERWGATGEVRVVGLSIDQGGVDRVRAHVEEKGYALPVAMADAEVRRAFGGIPGVPTTFILDREGVVRYRMVGVTGPGTIQRAVERLVER
jgi:thiol-disulfide isomerase/thioredoxin